MPLPALLALAAALFSDHKSNQVRQYAETILLQLSFSSSAQVLSSPSQLTAWAHANNTDPQLLVETLRTTGHPSKRIKAIAIGAVRAQHLPPETWNDVASDASLEILSAPLQDLTWDQVVRHIRRAAGRQSRSYQRQTPFPEHTIEKRGASPKDPETRLIQTEGSSRLRGITPQDRELLELYLLDRQSLHQIADLHWNGDTLDLVRHMRTIAPASTPLQWTQRYLQTRGATRSDRDPRPILSARQSATLELVYVQQKTLDEAADLISFQLSHDTHARRLWILKDTIRQAQVNLLKHLQRTVPSDLESKKRPSKYPVTEIHRLAYELLAEGMSTKAVGERVQPHLPPQARAPHQLAKRWSDSRGLRWPPFEAPVEPKTEPRSAADLDQIGAKIYRYRQWKTPWYELNDLYGVDAKMVAMEWAARHGREWPP